VNTTWVRVAPEALFVWPTMRIATGGGDGFLNRVNPRKVKPPSNAIKTRKLKFAIHASNHMPIFPSLLRDGFVFLIPARDAGVMPQDILVLFLSNVAKRAFFINVSALTD
jgi:hypothetical protein